MRTIEIKNNYNGNVIFSHTCDENTIKKTVEKAVEDWVSLIGANLSGVDLRGANLYDANLEGAYLSKANLLGANLSRANLRGANLYDAVLRKADLSEADLLGANLLKANLLKADLREADLRGADLRGANLSEADLSGADLREAVLEDLNLLPKELLYTQKQLISFGEYMVSKKRKELFRQTGNSKLNSSDVYEQLTLKEKMRSVYDSDLSVWSEKNGIKY